MTKNTREKYRSPKAVTFTVISESILAGSKNGTNIILGNEGNAGTVGDTFDGGDF